MSLERRSSRVRRSCSASTTSIRASPDVPPSAPARRACSIFAGLVPRPFGPVFDRAAVRDALGLVRLLWAVEKG